MADPSNPLTTWRFLWEAMKLPSKNWEHLLPIIILSPMCSSLLFMSNYYSLYPLLFDLFINLYVISPPASQKVTILESICIAIYSLVSSFLLVTSVTAATKAYLLTRHVTPPQHHLLKRSLKGPVITQLYIAFLGVCFMLSVSAPVVLFVMVSDGSVGSIVFGFVLALVVMCFYLHLAAVWWLSIVVSVLEDDCYGMVAVARATELVKERRRQGSGITILMTLASGATYGGYTLSTAFVPHVSKNPLANRFIIVNVAALCNIVFLAAYTLFYYECKKRQREEAQL